MDRERQPRFEIDASVVYQLGEKLISDEVQALVELVKNSYDADADYAHITIETDELVGNHSSTFPESRGYIIIEDNGIGMDWDDIERGWLTISASPKREMRESGKTTEKGRTPLGEKGLGRLGSQRLGRNIEIWTSKKVSSVEHYVGVNWKDFSRSLLSRVPVYYKTRERTRTGTRIVISGLSSPGKWKGGQRDELIGKLHQLLFPFEELRPFDVFLTVNGVREDLDSISRKILEVAEAQFSIRFDGEVCHIEGEYRPQFLLKQGRSARSQFQELIQQDQGADFYAYLEGEKLGSVPGLRWAGKPGYFVSFKEEYRLEDLGGVELVRDELADQSLSHDERRDEVANPGSFRGVIYSFKRRGTDLSAISDVFNTQSQFSKYIGQHSGVRVFRDGFGIRPFGLEGNDWLELGSGWTSATSYYGLKPENVIGYVALSARSNSQLEEATDREGFVESPYSRNFHHLMKRAVKRINLVNESLRRGYLDYVRFRAEQDLSIADLDISETFEKMRDTSNASRKLKAEVARAGDAVESSYDRVKASSRAIESEPLLHTEQERAIAPVLQEVEEALREANSILKQVKAMLPEAERLGKIADVLESDLEHLRNELEMFSELAGLGMTAEALSHEMKIIADGLVTRTRSLLRTLKRRKSSDPEIVTYTEHVYGAVGRMRKQLSHLDPSLRYVREQRDTIGMLSFFEEIAAFYRERLARSNLEMSLVRPFEDFTIRMNKGKLTQVIDNLILNSEYWLREDVRKSRISEGKLYVKAQAPLIDIYDTGQGVAPFVEHYLFQPFVTTKPEGEGRGLGLFIARQLLSSSGCLISLLPDRNRFDRRYVFRIDFSGAMADE
jgi:signal transduction histidine kinase